MTTQQPDQFDLFVIGGGINGAGIALDAAGRGIKTALCEMNDLGSATSSGSSKLVHGGLRYLEHYEFNLVRKALKEREILLNKAPHIIKPLRFRLPHRPHLRPAWMIRIGLFMYDHLSKLVTLKGSHGVRFGNNSPLIPQITQGFEYSDSRVDDARLVVLNALAAKEQGAEILVRHKCVKAERHTKHWTITLEDQNTGALKTIEAKVLINAAGPWVTQVFDDALPIQAPKKIRLVKGSHIIVPKIHDQPEAYILQNEDGRIVFVIPYLDKFSLVGTTDVDWEGDASEAKISDEEVDYLIEVVNDHFSNNINRDSVVSTYSAVRPLMDEEVDNPQAVTRDYSFEVSTPATRAPLLSVFGGKLTTYRILSEAAVDKMAQFFPGAKPAWTAEAKLPGGDFSNEQALMQRITDAYPWLPVSLAQRFANSYGTLTFKLLGDRQSVADLGECFGGDFYQAELDYLVAEEWAQTPEDVLTRRTKQHLFLSEAEQQKVAGYLAPQIHSAA